MLDANATILVIDEGPELISLTDASSFCIDGYFEESNLTAQIDRDHWVLADRMRAVRLW